MKIVIFDLTIMIDALCFTKNTTGGQFGIWAVTRLLYRLHRTRTPSVPLLAGDPSHSRLEVGARLPLLDVAQAPETLLFSVAHGAGPASPAVISLEYRHLLRLAFTHNGCLLSLWYTEIG